MELSPKWTTYWDTKKTQLIQENQIIPCILFHHNRIHIDISSNRNNRKCINSWKLNNTLLNDNLEKKEINTSTPWKNKNNPHALSATPQKLRQKGIIKISAEISEIETTKNYKESNETNN